MLERARAARKNEAGFTLIELLMVVVILGVLAGIVVFAVNGINDRGEVAACKADMKTVQVAQEAHYAKSSGYAASIAALKTAGFMKDSDSKYVTTDATGAVTKVGTAPTGC